MVEVEAKLEELIKAQVSNDKETGAVGIEEANTNGWHADDGAGEWISKAAEDQLVSICSLINMLTDKAQEIYKKEQGLAATQKSNRKAIISMDLFYVDDNAPRGEIVTKQQTEGIVSLYAKKGTKLRWNVLDQMWEDKNGLQFGDDPVSIKEIKE